MPYDDPKDTTEQAVRFEAILRELKTRGYTTEALELVADGMARANGGEPRYVPPAALVAAVCAIARQRYGIEAADRIAEAGLGSSRAIGELAIWVSEQLDLPPVWEELADYDNLPAYEFQQRPVPSR